MPAFIQTLVLIFCHLIPTQLDTVLEFLSTVNVNGQSGLEIVVSKWLGVYGEIQGFYAVKISTVALTQLYLSPDTRLQHIQLQGELIIDANPSITCTDKEIRTRSIAKSQPDRYTTVSFHTKAMQLLVGEYLQQRESKQSSMLNLDKHDDENSEDWEFEDVEEDYFGNEEIDLMDPEMASDPVYLMDVKVCDLIVGTFSLFLKRSKDEEHVWRCCSGAINDTKESVGRSPPSVDR
jgi:importin-9